jgi:hypothetical protein
MMDRYTTYYIFDGRVYARDVMQYEGDDLTGFIKATVHLVDNGWEYKLDEGDIMTMCIRAATKEEALPFLRSRLIAIEQLEAERAEFASIIPGIDFQDGILAAGANSEELRRMIEEIE